MINRNLGVLYLKTDRKEVALTHFKTAYTNLSYADLNKDFTAQAEKVESDRSRKSVQNSYTK
jgi:hypothetical protein